VRLVAGRAEASTSPWSIWSARRCRTARRLERALRQILINLLSNAVKFTPVGGRITVNAELDGEQMMALTVSDTGIGIATCQHRSRRSTVPASRGILSKPHEGTGSPRHHKRLAELQGGSAPIQSE